MRFRQTIAALPALLAVAVITACAAPAPASPVSDATEPATGHGTVAGAAEVAEAPLALLSVDRDGTVGMIDLASAEADELGTVAAPRALASDGRYAFVTTASGLEIIDSGRWSWHHGDHFHYYLAGPRIVGPVTGQGPATVSTGLLSTAGATGVFFAGSREAVLLDNEQLAAGVVHELFRIHMEDSTGLIAPLGDGAVIATADQLGFHDGSGAATDAAAPCVSSSGATTTALGLVIGCADGAVLSTWKDGRADFAHIPYPQGTTVERAYAFDGRKGRTVVAGVAGEAGFWLLDTRARTWQFVATEAPLQRVSAVDDELGHVVAVDREGRLHVHRTTDGGSAVTAPVIAGVTEHTALTVDAHRAYLNDPDSGVAVEIDFADDGRISRELQTPTSPWLIAEVGR